MLPLRVKFTADKRARFSRSLWVGSWFCVLAGVLTLSLGVYLECELNRRSEAMDNGNVHLVPNTLILVGVLASLVNLSGARLCGDLPDAARFARCRGYFLPYSAGASAVALLMLLASVVSLTTSGGLEDSLRNGLRNGVRFYKDTDTPGRCHRKWTVDQIQMEFRCCGNNDYRDWFDVQWVSNRYLDFSSQEVKDRIKSNVDGRYLIDGVPFSCCNPNNPRPCIQSQVTNDSAHFSYEYQTEELNIWMVGCREALLSYYTGLMRSIGTWVLLFYLAQVGALVGIRYVSTATEAALSQESAECETEGFLLEKGPKETLLALVETVKKACNFNQVETTAVATEPAK